MTFATRAGGLPRRVIDPIGMPSVTNSPGGGGTTTWRLTFSTVGQITFTSSDSGGANTAVNTEWYIPNTTAIGSSYWVRMTVTAGTSPSPGTVGSWTQISTNQEWDWVRTTVGTTTATLTLDLASDSGGATIVGTKTGIALSLEKNL